MAALDELVRVSLGLAALCQPSYTGAQHPVLPITLSLRPLNALPPFPPASMDNGLPAFVGDRDSRDCGVRSSDLASLALTMGIIAPRNEAPIHLSPGDDRHPDSYLSPQQMVQANYLIVGLLANGNKQFNCHLTILIHDTPLIGVGDVHFS